MIRTVRFTKIRLIILLGSVSGILSIRKLISRPGVVIYRIFGQRCYFRECCVRVSWETVGSSFVEGHSARLRFVENVIS